MRASDQPEPNLVDPVADVFEREKARSQLEAWRTRFAEDRPRAVAQFIADLQRAPSPSGDGKRLRSGLAYWQEASAIAWRDACDDPSYAFMRRSIDTCEQAIEQSLGQSDLDVSAYVSFGVGTGEKDTVILGRLTRLERRFYYAPVDLSAEMLASGSRRAIVPLKPGSVSLLPAVLDFSDEPSLRSLKAALEALVGGGPILYGLLGNALANFDDDRRLLEDMANLLRPQDRLLLELATTEEISEAAAHRAAAEYAQSSSFAHFSTSALRHGTDCVVDLAQVSTRGKVARRGDVIEIDILYNSARHQVLRILMGDEPTVAFPVGDTIRLFLSRKYSRTAIGLLIKEANLSTEVVTALAPSRNEVVHEKFGTLMMLVRRVQE